MASHKPYSTVSRQEGYEKDIIISQLKSEIWELKQGERECSEVLSHNQQLETQLQLLKDDKYRVESELRAKGQDATKTLGNYRQRVDVLEQQLTEKKIEIQELRAENIAQREHSDHKQLEVSRLKTETLHLEDSISRLQQESLNLKNEVDQMRDHKRKMIADMELLIEANDSLQAKSIEQEKALRSADYEKAQQDRYVDSLKAQIIALDNDISSRLSQIKEVQGLTQELRVDNASLERELGDLEKSRERLRNENLNNQAYLKEEVSKNFELNQQILTLESGLRSKTTFIEELKRQLDDVKRDVHETLEHNDSLSNEVERLRRNYEIATTQNAELVRQLESFSEQDEEMRSILDRKSQVREIRLRVDNFTRQCQGDLRMASSQGKFYPAATGTIRHNYRSDTATSSKPTHQQE